MKTIELIPPYINGKGHIQHDKVFADIERGASLFMPCPGRDIQKIRNKASQWARHNGEVMTVSVCAGGVTISKRAKVIFTTNPQAVGSPIQRIELSEFAKSFGKPVYVQTFGRASRPDNDLQDTIGENPFDAALRNHETSIIEAARARIIAAVEARCENEGYFAANVVDAIRAVDLTTITP